MGKEKEMAEAVAEVILSAFGFSQGFSFALKNHILHVFSLPGEGVAGGR